MKWIIPVVVIAVTVSPCHAFHKILEAPLYPRAFGADHSETAPPPLQVDVFAPDWVWQKERLDSSTGTNITILMRIVNASEETVQTGYVLSCENVHMATDFYKWNGDSVIVTPPYMDGELTAPPGITRHILPPLVPLASYPTGVVHVVLTISPGLFRLGDVRGPAGPGTTWSAGSDEVIQIPIRTIRGEAVSDSLWAKLLPALIGLVWCGVVTFFMRRYMKPGTWRRTFTPDTEEFHPCENP